MWSSGKHATLVDDPEPWLGANGHRCANEYGRQRQPYTYAPRPEIRRPVTNQGNPILERVRRWDHPIRFWAETFDLFRRGKLRPNSKQGKALMGAAQLGPARLVPFDDDWIIKGGRHNSHGGSYSDNLWAAIAHADAVITRLHTFNEQEPAS